MIEKQKGGIMEFYLRVEAVNLSNFIFDTTDLSTVRGGGLLLLDAINRIDDHFTQLEAISTGASSGLFSFTADNLESAQILQQQIVDFLNLNKKFKHATFVIDTLPVGKTFTEDKEKLLALNRWQQMQSSTVVFPKNDQQNAKFPICQVDDISPSSSHKIQKGDDSLIVSESVYQRREYGRKQKQIFYKKQTKLKNLPNFVNELDELAYDIKRDNLHHKMAVIYLDGNSFGTIQREICQGDDAKEALQLFDEQIKEYRRGFLHDLLKDTIGKSEWTYKHDEPKHRLETLLWGGDEILLVVPAWLGWWTLSYFFQKSKDWEFPDPNSDTKVYPLTHAAGLVFCHHNAPIHRIKDLAMKLGDLAKAKSREVNSVAYQVLESFNDVGENLEDLKSFINKRCGESGLKSDDLIILGNEMGKALSAMEPIKRAIPKGKVYAIVQALLHAPTEKADELIAEAERQLNHTLQTELKQLQNSFGENREFWLHLIELWDYI
jgi:hypothetical protein